MRDGRRPCLLHVLSGTVLAISRDGKPTASIAARMQLLGQGGWAPLVSCHPSPRRLERGGAARLPAPPLSISSPPLPHARCSGLWLPPDLLPPGLQPQTSWASLARHLLSSPYSCPSTSGFLNRAGGRGRPGLVWTPSPPPMCCPALAEPPIFS